MTINAVNLPNKTKWEHSQKLEKEYNESDKPKAWGVPYSFKYWADFIDLKDFDGINIEVGCGQDGFWRFSDKIIGTDSLDFSSIGKNFVQTQVERLPFDDNHFRDCYAINMLDHTLDPKLAMKEMIRVASHRVYIITNTYSPIIKPLMKIFDKIHPYHLTDQDIINLVPCTAIITNVKIKEFTELKTAKFIPKMKLLFAQSLGTHRLLIHLDKRKMS